MPFRHISINEMKHSLLIRKRNMAIALGSARSSARRAFGILDMLSLLRQRRALAQLDDARLADIGLTREEADSEANRAIWDVPVHWTC